MPEACQGQPWVGQTHGLGPFPSAGPFLSMLCVLLSARRFKNGQGSNLDGGNYHVYENGSLEIKMILERGPGHLHLCCHQHPGQSREPGPP